MPQHIPADGCRSFAQGRGGPVPGETAAMVVPEGHDAGLAADAGHPPFTAEFEGETPRNSGPPIYHPAGFRSTFGTDARRRRIIAASQSALDALTRHGLVWHFVLVGGSFIRPAGHPAGLDGLIVHSLGTDDIAATDRIVRGIPALMRRYADIDFRFCPVDIDPVVLIKRLLFFADLFGFDKETENPWRGSVMVIPHRQEPDAAGGAGACAI